MSIYDEIDDWVARGSLFRVFPVLDSDPLERHLFASTEVNRLITGPWTDDTEEYRAGKLWQDFDRFVLGGLIAVSLDNPYKKPKTTYLARLDPGRDEVWDIRSRDPKPGIRVFGRFAGQDRFIALTWEYREKLGGPGSREFRYEINRCKSEWRKLFPSYPPHNGSNVNEYVSKNIFPV